MKRSVTLCKKSGTFGASLCGTGAFEVAAPAQLIDKIKESGSTTKK